MMIVMQTHWNHGYIRVFAAGFALVFALAACSQSGSLGTPSASTGPPASPTAATSINLTACTDADLAVSGVPLTSAADTAHIYAVLTNVSPNTCTLQGVPTVSYSDVNGAAFGGMDPVDDIGAASQQVTLAPTEFAYIQVSMTPANHIDTAKCGPTKDSAALRIGLPGGAGSGTLELRQPVSLCTSEAWQQVITVGPVTPDKTPTMVY
jgi:hypothetical protein